MLVKELNWGNGVCEYFKVGIDKLANVVKVILGFKGCNVVLQKSFGVFCVIKDGVSVAKEIEFFYLFENMGV